MAGIGRSLIHRQVWRERLQRSINARGGLIDIYGMVQSLNTNAEWVLSNLKTMAIRDDCVTTEAQVKRAVREYNAELKRREPKVGICPFCGWTPKWHGHHDGGWGTDTPAGVRCKCGAIMRGSKEKSIKAWNKRKPLV
jgi:hypothetical protein